MTYAPPRVLSGLGGTSNACGISSDSFSKGSSRNGKNTQHISEVL